MHCPSFWPYAHLVLRAINTCRGIMCCFQVAMLPYKWLSSYLAGFPCPTDGKSVVNGLGQAKPSSNKLRCICTEVDFLLRLTWTCILHFLQKHLYNFESFKTTICWSRCICIADALWKMCGRHVRNSLVLCEIFHQQNFQCNSFLQWIFRKSIFTNNRQ